MTNEQINAAIAEMCGWKEGVERYVQNLPLMKAPPDYCNDLNAMHEAEGTLGKSLYRMEAQLKRMAGAICFHASARQRAEAFLRTVGKWESTTEDSSVVGKEVQA